MKEMLQKLLSENVLLACWCVLAAAMIFTGATAKMGSLYLVSMIMNIVAGIYVVKKLVPKFLYKKRLSNMVVIGLSGEKECGKTTVANYLEEKCGYYHTFFAKTLKIMCKEVFGLTDKQINDQNIKELPFEKPLQVTRQHMEGVLKIAIERYPGVITHQVAEDFKASFVDYPQLISPRHVMQILGTEMLRDHIDQDFHIMCLYKEVSEQMELGRDRFVIADCRFPNERVFIRNEYNGYCTLIQDISKDTSSEESRDKHSSENSLGGPEEYDFVIQNTKTGVEVLYDDVRDVLCKVHTTRAKGPTCPLDADCCKARPAPCATERDNRRGTSGYQGFESHGDSETLQGTATGIRVLFGAASTCQKCGRG